MNSIELKNKVIELKEKKDNKAFIKLTGIDLNAEVNSVTLVKVFCKLSEELKK